MKSLIALVLCLITQLANGQTCTSTLNPGADVAAAIGSASGGDVICLNSGSYPGPFSINARPSGKVIIRSTSGVGANVTSNEIYRSTNLVFKNLTLCAELIDDFGSAPHTGNISFVNNTRSCAMFVNLEGMTTANILLYGDTWAMARDAFGSNEGNLTISCVSTCSTGNTVKIQQSMFDGAGGCDDGIHYQANNGNVIIGPGNTFKNYVQSTCTHGGSSPHSDAIQYVGGSNAYIRGNYFSNNSVHLGFYDGFDTTEVTNNIFDGQAADSGQSLQMGGIQGMQFSHNTFYGTITSGIGTKFANTQNSGWIIENNVLVNSSALSPGGDQPGCGSDCIVRYNDYCTSTCSLITGGTNNNNVNVTDAFNGGSHPSTWSGWSLTSGSSGHGSGNDSKDRGVLFRKPSAPANIR